ncbi:MAG: hypothetical protein GXO02_05475, partial [Epsilonproteobacteria bacterium]|nr:hypothetical protein [Campylobacterota bacterium]
MICIFDIETIPDIEIIKKDSNYQDLSDYEATIKYLKNFEEENNNSNNLKERPNTRHYK